MESYLDTGDRGMFVNAREPRILHPQFAPLTWEADACAPLVVSGIEVTALRERLAKRAAAAVAGLGPIHAQPPGSGWPAQGRP